MTSPLFFVAKISGESFCACGKPAVFQISQPPPLEAQSQWCGICTAAYVLQYLKNHGVAVEELREVFPMLSELADAPVPARMM